jgi:hypothetical protein
MENFHLGWVPQKLTPDLSHRRLEICARLLPILTREPDPLRILVTEDESWYMLEHDQAILLTLAEQPFSAIQELAWLTHRPRTTVHMRLTQSLRSRMCHLQLFLHLLLHSQNLDCVALSQQLLAMLE